MIQSQYDSVNTLQTLSSNISLASRALYLPQIAKLVCRVEHFRTRDRDEREDRKSKSDEHILGLAISARYQKNRSEKTASTRTSDHIKIFADASLRVALLQSLLEVFEQSRSNNSAHATSINRENSEQPFRLLQLNSVVIEIVGKENSVI
jgi:hypothetical protein